MKNKLDIPSDFAVYFLRNRTKSHKYSTNFFKNLERKCRMLSSKILVIFNPICLVSVKNRHIDQNQEKIGTKSANRLNRNTGSPKFQDPRMSAYSPYLKEL